MSQTYDVKLLDGTILSRCGHGKQFTACEFCAYMGSRAKPGTVIDPRLIKLAERLSTDALRASIQLDFFLEGIWIL